MTHGPTEDILVRRLPEYMPRHPDSGNYRLMKTITHEIDGLHRDVESVDRASTVQHADTIPQLERLAELVDEGHEQSDSKEKYRAKVLAEYQKNTSEGTVRDILTSISVILNGSFDSLRYYRLPGSDSVASIGVPSSKIDASTLTESELANIVDELAPAGKKIETRRRGDLQYITPEDYQNGNYDPDKGYAGLSNGSHNDPDGSDSGTYAGLVE